ncbi:MAG: Calx-beta domain-containing protein [Verrucomicrobiota bacterium]
MKIARWVLLGLLISAVVLLFQSSAPQNKSASARLVYAKPDTSQKRPKQAAASTANRAVSAPTVTGAPSTPKSTTPSAPAASSVFQEFKNWTERYVSEANPASRARLLDSGVALAESRREALSRLINTDPQRALSEAIPYRIRRQLPESITSLLEERVNGRGDYAVLGAVPLAGKALDEPIRRRVTLGEKTYRAYVYGRRLHQTTENGLAMHGIALNGAMAVHEEPMQFLEPEEARDLQRAKTLPVDAVCSVSGARAASLPEETWVRLGHDYRVFCRPGHAQQVNERFMAAEKSLRAHGQKLKAGPPSGAPPPDAKVSITQGTKTLLFMRVRFPDDPTEPITEADAYNVMVDVNQFFVDNSYRSTAIITTVAALVTLPQTKLWYSAFGEDALQRDARAVTKAAGYDYLNYDLDMVIHTSVPGFDWGGLAYVGARGVWLQTGAAGVICHELGHNYGLLHANYWDTTRPGLPPNPNNYPFDNDSLVGRDSIIGPGLDIEYGDPFDTMGGAGGYQNHFNAMSKFYLNWLPPSEILFVENSGTNRIYAFDHPTLVRGKPQALVIEKDAERLYWGSIRSLFPNNPALANGLQLHWGSFSGTAGNGVLLDTTPGTRRLRNDSALVVGRTFSDPAAMIHITPVGRGTEQGHTWMDVVVNVGLFLTNEPPQLSVAPSRTTAVPGQPISFTASASDPNGDAVAYHWDFGDETFGLNSPVVTKAWSTNGEFVVRCVVSDMKGGVTSTHLVVTIGAPGTLRISGQVLDTFGKPVQGVRVHNGMLTTNRTINLPEHIYTFTDSDGRYTLVNLSSNSYVCGAYLHGYITRPRNFLNPLTLIDADAQNADFLAEPIPQLAVIPDGSASEAALKTAQFVLLRLGPTNQSLTVKLTASGSALPVDDYAEFPEEVTLDAGAVVTNVVVTPIQDTIYEGPEIVTLGLQEQTNVVRNTNYFPSVSIPGWDIVEIDGQPTWMLAYPDFYTGVPTQNSLRLEDDDAPTVPTITLFLADTVAVENQNDAAVYLLERVGNIDQELTVKYEVSGTAVNGADFATLSGEARFASGQDVILLNVFPLNDQFVEGNESVHIAVKADPAYNLGAESEATAVIVDDDLPKVAVYATDSIATEGGNTGEFTFVREGDLNRDLQVSFLVRGTATLTRDYAPLSGTVTIFAGNSIARLTLTPREDSQLELDETVEVFVADSTTYNIGIPNVATVVIQDNEIPTVTINASDNTADETGDFGEFTVRRVGTTATDLFVNFRVAGTAIHQSDFVAIGNRVRIPAGASFARITITGIDDAYREQTETIFVELLENATYNLGATPVAQVNLNDNDTGNRPAIGFTLLTSQGLESNPEIVLSVSVSSNPGDNAGVTNFYAVTGGTAIEDLDFEGIRTPSETLFPPTDPARVSQYTGLVFSTGMIIFPPDPGGALPLVTNIVLTGINDSDVELSETILVTLLDRPPYEEYSYETNITTDPNDPNISVTNIVITTNMVIPPINAYFDVYRTHTYSILDDDTNIVTVTVADGEGNEAGPKPALLSFQRTGPLNSPLEVFFQVTGSASDGVDFESVGTRLVFPAGRAQVDLPIVPLDDPATEVDETVRITLISAAGGQIGSDAVAEIIIHDNDGNIEFSATTFRFSEGLPVANVTVIRGGNTNILASVQYTTQPGTAAPALDFVTTAGTLFFAPGEILKTIEVPLVNDLLVEPEESFSVLLSNSTGGGPLGGQNTARVFISDDDTELNFAAAGFEVNENATNAIIRVQRSGIESLDVSVNYQTLDGTATNALDYTAASGTVRLLPGETSKTFTIPILDDALLEGDETVQLLLTNVVGASIGSGGQAVLTIVDDECTLEFSAPAFSAAEYVGQVAINVQRLGGTVNPVSVEIFTTDETARSGLRNDYIRTSQTITFRGDEWVPSADGTGALQFRKGETNQTVVIEINDDVLGEGHETFRVGLRNPAGPAPGSLPGATTLGASTNSIVTILDNEIPGQVDYEFNPGLGADDRVWALALAADGKVFVGGDFTTMDGFNMPGVARLHSDGYLDSSFNPGSGPDGSVRALAVEPGGKLLVGGAFTIFNTFRAVNLIRLNEDGTVDIGFFTGLGADDIVQAIAVSGDGSILIGGDFRRFNGTSRPHLARLNNTGALDNTFATSPNDSVLAIALQPDGRILLGGRFTSINGQSRRYVARLLSDGTLDPAFDPLNGPNAAVTSLSLQSDGKVIIGGQFTSVADATRARIARLNEDGTLDRSFAPGSGANAEVRGVAAQSDGKVVLAGEFTLLDGQERNRFGRLNADGSVDVTYEIGAGANGRVLALAAQADSAVVLGGEFTAIDGLSRNYVARIHGSEAFGSGIIQFRSATFAVLENTATALISVLRTGNTKNAASIDYATSNGTAIAGEDYQDTRGTLQFAPGETLKTFSIPILDDSRSEGNETVNLTLSMGGSAVLIIEDDESAVAFSAPEYRVAESAGTATVTVKRTGSSASEIQVDYTIAPGTAESEVDYSGVNGTLIFAAGETEKSFMVAIVEDDLIEPDETVLLTLTNPTGGVGLGSQSSATLTILNNDSAPAAYTLTILPSPGGIVTPGTGSYPTNTLQIVTATADRDFVFVRWEGTIVSTANPLVLLMDRSYTLTARFRATRQIEGFESGNLLSFNWQTSANAPWLVQSNVTATGKFAARSGPAKDLQSSSLTLQIVTLSGTGAFDFRVSSEEGWDYFEFLINGVRQQRWSGELAWRNFLFPLQAGLNILEWRYSKDANFSAGFDGVFLDNLYLPLDQPDQGNLRALLSATVSSTGTPRIQLQGRVGQTYVLEASSDLTSWKPISTNTVTSGNLFIEDREVSGLNARFYRAVTQ